MVDVVDVVLLVLLLFLGPSLFALLFPAFERQGCRVCGCVCACTLRALPVAHTPPRAERPYGKRADEVQARESVRGRVHSAPVCVYVCVLLAELLLLDALCAEEMGLARTHSHAKR